VESIERVYFGDIGENKIRRCGLAGANKVELVTTGLEAPGSIAIDRTGGKMYWTDWPAATARIQRANLDGSNVEDVLIGLNGPYGIALDVPSGKMYWTEFSAQKVRRANLDGTNIEDLVTTGLSHPNGIVLDLNAGKMYWSDDGLPGKIQRADLNGSNIETLVTTGLIEPMEIALDLTAGKMYWTDLGTDKVQRANLDGSNVEDLVATGLDTPVGIDLDLVNGKIYFSDSGPGGAWIKRCNLDGSGVENIIDSGIGSCYGLEIGPQEAECADASLDEPWILVVSGVEPQDYTVYMIFDGQGTIDELGAFNVPDSAGMYAVAPDCSVSGYLWTDGYAPFTGYISTPTTAEIEMMGLSPMPLLKVQDVGALQGCWSGRFVQDTTGTTKNVTLSIDMQGVIQSSSGLVPPVSGKMYYEPGWMAGHIKTGEAATPWDEIHIRDATLLNDQVIQGTFALDCDCPGGTFILARCDLTGVEDDSPVRSLALHPNYPNPFNPRTTIAYTLVDAGRVIVRIYDAAGRFVRTLVDEDKTAGPHSTAWDGVDDTGRAVSSGVYFVRLESGGAVETRKIVLLK